MTGEQLFIYAAMKILITKHSGACLHGVITWVRTDIAKLWNRDREWKQVHSSDSFAYQQTKLPQFPTFTLQRIPSTTQITRASRRSYRTCVSLTSWSRHNTSWCATSCEWNTGSKQIIEEVADIERCVIWRKSRTHLQIDSPPPAYFFPHSLIYCVITATEGHYDASMPFTLNDKTCSCETHTHKKKKERQ